MKLQLSVDLTNIKGMDSLIEKTKGSIDVYGYGTPLLMNFGLAGLHEIRKSFPNINLLADMKIADIAGYEVEQAYKQGANAVTILGLSNNQTIKDGIVAARKAHKEILIDMVGVKQIDLAQRTREIDELKPDYIEAHIGYDLQALGQTPFEDLNIIKENTKYAKTAVAGGINLKTAEKIIALDPDLLIIGAGISTTDNPKKAASDIKKLMEKSTKLDLTKVKKIHKYK